MITKFIICLLAAGVLGFIIGWMLSSLVKNEKLEEKYTHIKDELDDKRAELNQVYSDLDAKDHELTLSSNNIQQVHKELLMKKMDIEEYEKNGFVSHDTGDLELENNTLKEEISEYKYLENENDLLHNELKELSVEKEMLLQKIESYQKLPNSATVVKKNKNAKNMHKNMKDSHIKTLQKDLKTAKKKLRKMSNFLVEISKVKKRHKSKKESSTGDNIMVFDFNKEPLESSIKKSLKTK